MKTLSASIKTIGLVAAIVSLGIIGCNSNPSKDVDISGTWETVYLKVQLNTINNTDSALTIEANLSEFPAKLGIQSNIGTYNRDGTYEDSYIMPDGRTQNTAGTWSSLGDTVLVEQQDPEFRLHKFRCELKGDTGIFTGPVDFDNDGQQDDDFYGVSVLRK